MSKSDLSCKVCGSKLLLNESFHYIARDEITTGLATLGRHEEELLYDAFDCPVCGCQNIVGERKRGYFSMVSKGHPDEVAFVECDESDEEKENNPKCLGARYDEENLECMMCSVDKECKEAYGAENKTDQGDNKPGCFGAMGYKTREQVQDGCFDCELIDECRKESYE